MMLLFKSERNMSEYLCIFAPERKKNGLAHGTDIGTR